jgi:hypothetical protein
VYLIGIAASRFAESAQAGGIGCVVVAAGNSVFLIVMVTQQQQQQQQQHVYCTDVEL